MDWEGAITIAKWIGIVVISLLILWLLIRLALRLKAKRANGYSDVDLDPPDSDPETLDPADIYAG
jgi:hypothetical protein